MRDENGRQIYLEVDLLGHHPVSKHPPRVIVISPALDPVSVNPQPVESAVSPGHGAGHIAHLEGDEY